MATKEQSSDLIGNALGALKTIPLILAFLIGLLSLLTTLGVESNVSFKILEYVKALGG